MTTPSNLYAEKIFSEHPLEMWTLDDETHYLSWIDGTGRDIKNWTFNESSVNVYNQDDAEFDDSQYEVLSVPFPTSVQNQITVAENSGAVTLAFVSESLKFDSSQIDPVSGCISLGFKMFSNDESISAIRVGYYIDGAEDAILKDVSNIVYGEWASVLEVFSIQPTETAEYVYMVIQIDMQDSDQVSDIFINGIVLGQGAEYFSNVSLGINYDTIPDGIYLPESLTQREGILAKPYGLSDANGYYLIHNDFALASQSGMPMVHGSNTSTILNPLTADLGIPNLMIPGKGFLTNLNKYKTLVLEFWIKVNHNGNNDSSPYRIVGPVAGTDGLYVDESFFILKIGNKHVSHFVGEWARPMLVHFEVSENYATLMIDGKSVISLTFDSSTTDFTQTKNGDGESQDWLGFYCPSEIMDSMELDCIAIYSQSIPNVVALRRYGYGQGVDYPFTTNTAYGGTSVYLDFSKSGYNKNIDYPNINKWGSGFSENVSVLENSGTGSSGVSYPTYSMPALTHPSKDLETWILNNREMALDSIADGSTFMMDPLLDGEKAFLSISGLSNFSGKKAEAFGAIFMPGTAAESDEIYPVFSIYNNSNTDRILVSVKNIDETQKVVYSVRLSGTEYDVFSTDIGEKTEILCGVYLSEFVSYISSLDTDIYDNDISIETFSFSNASALNLYIGSDPDSELTFDGKFKKFFVMNKTSLDRHIAEHEWFDLALVDGILVDETVGNDYLSDILTTYTTYEIKPLLHGPTGYILDIAAEGFWSDYVPLSVLMKDVYTDLEETETSRELDFMQFNIGYPENMTSDLFKSYVSFEYSNLFTGEALESYTIVSSGDVVEPGVGSPWHGKKFEVKDGSIVYAPVDEGEDRPEGAPEVFNLENIIMNIHLEFRIDSVSYQPITIKSLQISGVSLNHETPNPVQTRYDGVEIIPKTEVDGVVDYKAKNPYRILKTTDEYLYLTSKSGIELCLEDNTSGKLSVAINAGNEAEYNISSLQFAFNHRGFFSEEKELAFKIESQSISGKTLSFYVESVNEDNTRGILTVEEDGEEYLGVDFFLNGIEVRSPVLKRGEWTMLGLSFVPALSFSSSQGEFSIFSKILINNISYYQISEEQISQYRIFKKWSEVEGVDNDWDYWLGTDPLYPDTWEMMLTTQESSAISIGATDVYKIFMGTNKIISDSRSDDIAFALPFYQYIVYNNVLRQSRSVKPV
jgi:hypothetical protein